MKNFIENSEYVLDPHSHIWTRPGYSGISYSDGDEIELRIASIIEQASDTTVLSAELRQHCTDWPSLYHLSGTRANLLRPFSRSLTGDVLEIGAGCGAITRYLGECGANVLALEGSPRRAAIARSRTSDLKNVTVLAEKFDSFQCDHQFDVITLIGVLEYANLFTPAENPALAMLQQVRSLLKPDGKLIIAIENQLGLKYFAGAPEDHLGHPMYGIEGRYRNDQPQTFGRKVLADMLEQAGFVASEFFAPFPDYKLPVSIVTEEGFSNKNFDAAAFAWQSVRRDPQLPPILAFSPELAWPGIVENGIALDLANSFLIVAKNSVHELPDSSILAYHYSTERSSVFCKETRFLQTGSDSIELQYHLLARDSIKCQDGHLIRFDIPEKSEYMLGKPLSMELLNIVTRDGWNLEEVGAFLRRYLHILTSIVFGTGNAMQIDSIETLLPGECFDLVPQNIIIATDGTWHAIDKEWVLVDQMPVGWPIFRSLLLLVYTVSRFGRTSSVFPKTRMGFFLAAYKAAGLDASEVAIKAYGDMEVAVQTEVCQITATSINNWSPDFPLQFHNLNQTFVEQVGQIAALTYAKAEQEGQIAEQEGQIAEQEGQISILNYAKIERDELRHEIEALRQSTSWRITKPLRRISQSRLRFKRLVRICHNYRQKYPGLGGIRRLAVRCVDAIRNGGINGFRDKISLHERIIHKIPESEEAVAKKFGARRIDFLQMHIEKGLVLNPTIIFDHNGGGGSNTYTYELVKIIQDNGGSVLRVYYFDAVWFVQWIGNGDGMLFYTSSIEKLFEILSVSSSSSIVLNSLYGYPDINVAASYIDGLARLLKATLDFKIHDFYSLCPSPHLSNFEEKYCGVPQDHEVCKTCLKKNLNWYHIWYPEENRPIDIDKWRKPFSLLLEAATTVTFFDQSSIEIVRKAFHVEDSKVKIMPHAINYFKTDSPVDLKGALHIGILGTLSHIKGGNFVGALFEYIDEQGLEIPITVVGQSFVDISSKISVHGSYAINDLPIIISEKGINVILMPSIVPETFSYTISEAIKMGLPIVAFDIGAQGNRVKQYSLGKVVPLGSTPAVVLAAIQSILKTALELKI